MNRSLMREKAFFLLYQIEVQKENTKELIELFYENNEIEKKDVQEYITDIAEGVNNNQEKIVKTIEKHLKEDWKIQRISKINLALLKLAIYEIEYKEIPFKIVINEVVDTSPVFINGILASVIKEK